MENQTKKDFSPFQYLKNIFANGFVFVINTVISFWFTPYLKNTLGIEVFGLIPLATSVTSYLGIITQSINNSVSRYLTIELRKNDDEKANRVFNTAFAGILILVSIVIPIGIALIIFSPRLFDVPVDQERGVQLLFLGTVLAFIITAFDASFSVAAYSRNRFDLSNIVSLTARFGQIAVVVGLFSITKPSLFIVGLGIFTAAFLGISGDYYLWKRLLPQLHFNFSFFTKSLLRQLVGTSIWLLINRVGSLLFLNIELIIANKTLTLEMAGMYGALITVPSNLRVMGNVVGGIWGPTFLSKYSRKDFSGLDSTAKFSIKLIGLVMALPIGFLIGMAKPFLVAWLGVEFASMSWVMIAMIVHLPVNLSVTPLFSVQVSMNKVKVPALVTFLLGIVNVLSLIYLSKLWGPLGIAVGGGMVLTAKNLLFTPIYTARILGLKWWNYYAKMIPNVISMLLTAGFTYWVGTFFNITSMIHILIMGAGISVVYLVTTYFLGLNKDEKKVVLDLFQKKMGA